MNVALFTVLQVVLANNPISGVIIFIALTVANPLVSGAGLLTASVGLLVSIMVSADASGSRKIWQMGSDSAERLL